MVLSNQSQLARFAKKFLIFVVGIVLVDAIVGTLMKRYYDNQKGGLFYRANYVVNNTKADLLIFGSSRANHNYITTTFESKLNTTAYNCGRDGIGMYYCLATMAAVLERYTPKTIILDLRPGEFSLSEYGKLAEILPYHDNPAVYNYIKYDGKFEKYKLASKMYPYNSMFSTLFLNNHLAANHTIFDVEGYIPFTDTMKYAPRELVKFGPVIPQRVKVLEDMLQTLKKKNIKMFLVMSPSYCTFLHPDPTIVTVDSLCEKHPEVRFLNYEDDPAFSDYKLFKDQDHLNQDGSKKLTSLITDQLAYH